MHGLYNQQNLPYLAVKKCPKCNSLLPLDAKSCNNCQYSFIKNEVKKEEIKKEANQNTEALTKKDEGQAIKSIYCDNCGNKVLISQQFCPSCGNKINKTICPYCGQIQDARFKTCTRCNKPLNANELINDEIIEDKKEPTIIKENDIEKLNENKNVDEIKAQSIINEENISNEENDDIVKASNDIVENEVSNNLKEIVLLPRKRIFIFLQTILVATIALVCLFVPIVTKDTVYNTIFNLINKTATDSIITGKECIKLWINSPNDFSTISKYLVNENGDYLISSLPFVSSFINNFNNIGVQVSFYAISSFYLLTLVASLITLINSIIGFFNSKPFYRKSICFLMIVLLIGAILIQPNCIADTFKNYDCWILYGFALTFLFWFIIKLVFLKENKIYRKKKKEISKLHR